MAWVGLIRVWDAGRDTYRKLILRIEDTPDAGCLVGLYENDSLVGERLAPTPEQAIAGAIRLAQEYLHDTSITERSLDWVQM